MKYSDILGEIFEPLMDIIKLHIEEQPVMFDKLSEDRRGAMRTVIRDKVSKVKVIQTERFKANYRI